MKNKIPFRGTVTKSRDSAKPQTLHSGLDTLCASPSPKVCVFTRLLHRDMRKDLIEVPLLLVQAGAGGVGPLQVQHQIIHLSLEPLLGFLQGRTLGAHGLCVLLCFLEPLGQFFPKRIRPTVAGKGGLFQK